MKIKFLLLPEYGEQSKRKNEQIPLFFPLLAWRPCSGETAITTWILLFCTMILEPAGGT